MSGDRGRPNILLVMFDQMSALSLPCYGHPVVQAPNLASIAEAGVVFENAYCNSPLCSPSRFSMLTGRLPSRIGAYDNAAEFPSSQPTFVHHLRATGYRTCLSGKMDFAGADQLHGYEERLTTDLSPSDFGWTPDWDDPDRVADWYHSLLSVAEAGPVDRSLAMDYDEEACFQAVRWIHEASRRDDGRPFLLTVSFMHPHDPYLAPRAFWSHYRPEDIDLPHVPWIEPAARDPHSRRLFRLYDRGEQSIGEAQLRAARRAYYAMIGYIDAQLGRILQALAESGCAEGTVTLVTADHGDMLGERGLWYKMTFYEPASRVPLVLLGPHRLRPRRMAETVSLVDLMPTLVELGGGALDPDAPLDGRSLLPLASGSAASWPDAAFGEYLAEGTAEPLFMIRRGPHKFICGGGDPPLLFDLGRDPLELENLAERALHAALVARFAEEAAQRWDSAAIRRDVLDSQRRRRLVHRALLAGRVTPWDYEPRPDSAGRYYRNRGVSTGDPERRARLPRAPAAPAADPDPPP